MLYTSARWTATRTTTPPTPRRQRGLALARGKGERRVQRWVKAHAQVGVWCRLWHLYSAQSDEFLAHYHKRSNVESALSMVKRKFGASVRSKLPAAQRNKVLLKCLCHNLSVLVHSIRELGVAPKFRPLAEAPRAR